MKKRDVQTLLYILPQPQTWARYAFISNRWQAVNVRCLPCGGNDKISCDSFCEVTLKFSQYRGTSPIFNHVYVSKQIIFCENVPARRLQPMYQYICQLLLCWEQEYFQRALFSSTELEIDCRHWLVFPRCTNSELPFSISVLSYRARMMLCAFSFMEQSLGTLQFYSDISPLFPFTLLLLPPFLSPPLVYLFPSSVIYRNRILRNVFCLWFFNCLSGRCIHQANQGELHLPRAQNLNGGITEFRIWRDVVSFPSNFPERLPPACVHSYV